MLRRNSVPVLSYWVRVVFVVLIGALWTPLAAQGFGQNKVRYRTFDFKVLKTEHLDIHYYGEEHSD